MKIIFIVKLYTLLVHSTQIQYIVTIMGKCDLKLCDTTGHII